MRLFFRKLRQSLRRLGGFTIFASLAWLVIFVVMASVAFRGRYLDVLDNMKYDMNITSLRTTLRFGELLKDLEGRFNNVVAGVEEKKLDGADHKKIGDYLVRSSAAMNRSDENSDYLFYGVIDGEYYDGLRWETEMTEECYSRPWFIAAAENEGRVVYSMPYMDARTGNYVVTLSQMMDQENVLALDINVDMLHEFTLDKVTDDVHKMVIILDRNGTVVAHTNKEEIGKNYAEEEGSLNAEIYRNWTDKRDGSLPDWFLYGKHAYMLGAYDINDMWSALTVMNSDSRVNELFRFLITSLLISVVGVGLMIATMMMIVSGKIKADEVYENLITLSRSYLTMHVIDLEFDTFQEINCTDKRLSEVIGHSGKHANAIFQKVAEQFCAEQSREALLAFIDLKTLPDRMLLKDSMTIEFLGIEQHWMRGRFVVAERDKNNRAKSVIWSVRSIDVEKREQDRLQYLAETDNLTGILNRGSGESRISELITQEEGIFILLDVDHFKSINDKYGHRTGDLVLVAVAKSLKKSFRENDIVMRLGGDEFVAFAGKVGTKEGAQRIIQRLFDNISRIQIPGAPYLQVHISVGVTCSSPDAKLQFKDIYKRADVGTYESKKTVGNMVTYDDSFPA